MGSTTTPLPSSSSAFFVICFFLLTHFILQSAGKQHSSGCLPFKCGNSSVKYPFYNDTNPMCGFGIINCHQYYQTPSLQMGETWLAVKHIFYNNNTLVVHRINWSNITRNLKSENWKQCSCSFDRHNFTIPKTDTISYEVKSPSIVVLVCKRDSLAEIQRGFVKVARNISRVCRDHDIFYRNAGNFNQNFQVPQHYGFLNQCVVVHLPVRERLMANCSDEDLLSLLYSEFLLQWKLPSGETINWKRKLVIGFSAAGVGILLTCLGFFIYHRYKRQQSASPALLSQDNSSSPSSKIKTDLEKGSTHFGVHIFTYEELEEATDNFHPSKELGDGGFGTVYYGKLQDGREVAVKRLYEHNFKRVEQFMNEVEILNRLRHQNLVTLYGCTSRHSRELLLVYEFIPNGTVADHLHGDRAQPGALKWPIRMNIALQTASALAYLHDSDVVHRDVKTNNILLDNNFNVKVADFGLSRLFPTDVTHISTAPQGTPGYLDPEYHQCYQLTEKSDVYSFGVVLVELISSKPAVDITRHRQEINLANMAINRIQNCVLHEFVDPYLGFESDEIIRNKIKLVAELAFRCLQHEKELRPPMCEVFEILMTIECEDGKAEKVDSPKDDIGSLKNIPQMLSPDSVTDKWVSRSTTPNGSS